MCRFVCPLSRSLGLGPSVEIQNVLLSRPPLCFHWEGRTESQISSCNEGPSLQVGVAWRVFASFQLMDGLTLAFYCISTTVEKTASNLVLVDVLLLWSHWSSQELHQSVILPISQKVVQVFNRRTSVDETDRHIQALCFVF